MDCDDFILSYFLGVNMVVVGKVKPVGYTKVSESKEGYIVGEYKLRSQPPIRNWSKLAQINLRNGLVC